MAVWDQFLTEQDKVIFAGSGYGARMGFGKKPAVLCIDVNRNFCGGDAPMPFEESLKKYRNSNGPMAWDAVAKIKPLLELSRENGIPVIYSTSFDAQSLFERGRWKDKNSRNGEDIADPSGNDIVSDIAPVKGDIVIRKSKPSVFFGTTLESYLVDLGVDTLLCFGTTTSGCVRATVIDGFSFNYRCMIVEECTFDRGEASHAISLFDLDQKYADVVSFDETMAYIASFGDAPALKAVAN
jgi:maleamate amidohydrolase